MLKVDDLRRKLEVIKLDVEEAIKNKYIDFIPQYIKLDTLLMQLKRFSDNYELLHNQIEREVSEVLYNIVFIIF